MYTTNTQGTTTYRPTHKINTNINTRHAKTHLHPRPRDGVADDEHLFGVQRVAADEGPQKDLAAHDLHCELGGLVRDFRDPPSGWIGMARDLQGELGGWLGT